MRVVLWGELFWPYLGGAELFAAHLMTALRQRGYDFVVVTSHDSLELPDEDSFQGIPIYRFHFRRALQPMHLEEMLLLHRRIATFLRAWQPRVVHINGVTPSAFYCALALKTDPVPLVVRLNRELLEHQSPRTEGTLLEHALRRANWVTSVSAAILSQARSLVPDVAARSSVIYNGVRAPAQPPPPAAEPRVLCVGRLVPDKGFDIAIDAFAALRAHWPDARLTIAGDGPERNALEERVRVHGIGAAVDFTGWIPPDEVPRLLAGATMVVMPSREDGLPNVALQATAHAVPIVSTATGGLPEVVRHGQTGLVVDGDAGAFAQAMAALLAQPAVARRMGLNGWRQAREVFDHERCVDAYDALYRRVAGARP